MVEKVDLEDNEPVPVPYSVWPRIVAMLTALVLVAVIFTLVVLLSTSSITPKKPDPPNIIFILADDLGWNDVSFHGSPQIPTPNIDALAASGVILNNYYTHPQCTPSRGALMSGKYANRLGLNHGDIRPGEATGLPLNVATLPEYMKKLDYKTHMIGKWHLGYHKKRYLPTRRGFDSFFGFLNDKIDYFDYTSYYKVPTAVLPQETTIISSENPDGNLPANYTNAYNVLEMFGVDIWKNEEVLRDFRGEYATNVFTNKALDVIEQHNTTKPLFLFVSHAATQGGNEFFPLQAPLELYERNNHIKEDNRRTYAGVVEALDESIGKIFEALNKKGMIKNSILVVSSDNGGDAKPGSGSNWPLRGTKYSLWEGGVRSVGVLWSPLLKLKKPTVSFKLMHITDWLPTFYFAAGGDLDDLGDIDGLNLWPMFLNKDTPTPRDEVLLNVDSLSSIGGLRKGDMKLIVSDNPAEGGDWYGPSGLEDSNVTDSFDDWVWANGSVIKNILLETKQWLMKENDTWRQGAAIVCGENFLPVSGKCDFSEGPCLYNVTEDPCEYKNIAKLFPEVVEEMLNRLRDLNATTLSIQNKEIDQRANPICHDFAYVPWLDGDEEFDCPF
ncbi:hypothetical protein JTE90_010984 [Oedothorax gibbosus]|uniref:Sulfatase N-terminal domain-containing protein n=1 Tax=Oedothorax gibbosus TaxID=931172 RepID=A0AAV6VEF4_9ARAC|nr:hypothetical protein JTE90_010984 [Oedothorax gibbosus]